MKLLNGPSTPGLLQTIKINFRPWEYLETCTQRYGDPFIQREPKSPNFVYFSHPQANKEIFTADPDLFDIRQGNEFVGFLMGEQSLLLLDGDRHQHRRRLLTPPFHGERLLYYSRLTCEITKQVTKQLRVGKPFRVRLLIQEITIGLILQALFGVREGQRYEQIRKLLASIVDFTTTSPFGMSLFFFRSLRQDWGPLSPWGHFLRQKQKLDEFISEEIRERREQGEHSSSDVLTLLMSAHDEAGQPMSHKEIIDELIELLITGHDTTVSSVIWALYWVHHLPEVHDKLLHELKPLGKDADPSEITKLPYLTAVCQEVLRMYPATITAMARFLKAPFQVMGYEFEAGTFLVPANYLTHYREDIYPEPKRFRPERFLEREFSPYEYLPFGGGNRICLGMAFAKLEMKLVLATIMSHFQLALVDNRKVLPVRHGPLMAPPTGMRMVVTSERPTNTLSTAHPKKGTEIMPQ